jgi:glycerophosphoryl diester phosphodiesterase
MRIILGLLALAIAASPAAAKTIEIQAHRGGTLINGKQVFAEESLAAYRHSAKYGFVFEVDAKLTSDRVPVAVHDATLDRTTSCTGEVRSFTLGALRRCRPRIATIAEVLELARVTGSKVNLEIKNVPTDPDFDATSAYANQVMTVVLASGLPREQLLIQSFLPTNLDVAKRRLPRVPTSLLTLNSSPDVIEAAQPYDWISPQWPASKSFVTAAHRADHPVVPYTLNRAAEVRAAARANVDAVITDDPLMAARALGLRPAHGLTARLTRRAGRVEATGRLRAGGRGCRGTITLRVLGAKRTLHVDRARLRRDCTYDVAVAIPRGATAKFQATIGFSGNSRLLPKLVGPRAVPREVPLAVPHAGQQAGR